MKILIIMAGFFPGRKYGGPPVSVDNFCSLMKDSNDCYIFTRNHDLEESKPYPYIECNQWTERNNCKVFYVSDEQYNKESFENAINDIKPDILYLQGIFQSCVLSCLQLAKKHHIKVVLAPRGELCKGALSIHKYKKIPYIALVNVLGLVRKNVVFQSTSDEETNAIHSYLKIPFDRIHYLTNIPSIPKKKYKGIHKEAGKARFVFISRIHPKKNLISAIKHFNEIKGKAVFDIYGPIEDEEYWQKCQEEINKLPNNIEVNYCGLVSHDEVHETFSKYDAFLFPTYSENYGHVIAESLVVGTPVIISDQTPWTNVNEHGAGWAIPLEQQGKYVEAMQCVVDSDNNNQRKMVLQYISEKLDLEGLRKEYYAIFRG